MEELIVRYKNGFESCAPASDDVHACLELCFFSRANLFLLVAGQHIHVQDGDLCLLGEGVAHRLQYNPQSPYTRYVVHVQREYIQPVLAVLGLGAVLEQAQQYSCLRVNVEQGRRRETEQSFLALWKECQKPGLTGGVVSARLQCHLALALQHLAKAQAPGRPEEYYPCGKAARRRVQQVVEYIDQHYAEPITLDALSQQLFVSKYYLSRIFTRTAGCTLLEYVQYRRVSNAQRYLVGTSRNILDICHDCGFNNLGHFYRTFSKFTGTSPQEYRRSAQ